MKKTVFICVLLICVIIASMPVSATTLVEDAFTIDDETRTLLSVSEDDTVIRVYFGYFMFGFSQRWSLEETFNDGWSLKKTSYVIASSGDGGNMELTTKCLNEGIVMEEPLPNPNGQTSSNAVYATRSAQKFYDMIDETSHILSVLGPFVTVQKTVYMHGYPMDGVYIYYETNIGDYVYYKNDWVDDEEYLVPLEEFYNFAEVEQEYRSLRVGGSGASTYDLSPYDLSNYKAIPNNVYATILYCAIPVGLILCGGVWFFLRKRKKTDPQAPTGSPTP